MEMTNEGEKRSVDYISCLLGIEEREKRKGNIVKGQKSGKKDEEK